MFCRIEQGKVGRRDRDVIRTLRETDRERLETRLRPIIDIPETPPTTKLQKKLKNKSKRQKKNMQDKEMKKYKGTSVLYLLLMDKNYGYSYGR